MRAMLATAILLASFGLDGWKAFAADMENPGGPPRLPAIVPKVTPLPGEAARLGVPSIDAGIPGLSSQVGLDPAQANAGILNGAAGSVEASAEVPGAPQDAKPDAPLVEVLAARQNELEKTLDREGPAASPESSREAAALFEKSLLPARGGFLSVLSRATGLAPLWSSARQKVAVQRHADRLLDRGRAAAERAAAALRLGQLKGRETLEALGETAASDPNPEVRKASEAALLEAAKTWTPILLKEMRLHPLSGRRAQAATSLGWIARFSTDPEIVDALARQSAVDMNHDVRLTAIAALSKARSVKALAALVNIRRLATKADIISATEVAIQQAIAAQQAAGTPTAPYHPAPGEFGSSKQPLHALALKRVIAVSAFFTAIEFVGGLMTGSLSLRADSMHLLADLGINAGALFSLWMSRRPPNSHKTYGYLKTESITGLLSAVAIAGMALYTLSEAIPRLWAPVAVPGLATIALAFSGLISNAVSTLLLRKYQEDNLSLKGAFLHAATDAVGSVGIIAAGALIYFFGWFIADPIITFLIVGLIVHTTWGLAKSSWNVLIDGVPPGVVVADLEADLLAVPGVASVYDLHAWSLNSSEKAMTAILFVKPGGDLEAVLAAAKAVVGEKYAIGHATLQVEYLKPPR